MQRVYADLHREIAKGHRERGMPPAMAYRVAASQARTIIQRWQAGVPDELVTVGMGSWISKAWKKITKPFKKLGKWTERKIFRPIGKGVKHVMREAEQHIIRPIAHWKYLSTVANIIPGYGQVLSVAIAAGQAARQIHKVQKQTKQAKQAMAAFEKNARTAFFEYNRQVSARGLMPMSFNQFKDALLAQVEGRPF